MLVLQHDLRTALSNLSQTNQGSMALLPSCISHQLGQGLFSQGHHGLAPQSKGYTVQAFLSKLVQVAFTFCFILF